MVTVTEADVVVMSNDNADSGSIVSTTFVPDITTQTFGCGDIGTTMTVDVTVEDASGATASCEASFIVQDNVDPMITCEYTTVQVGDIDASINGFDVTSSFSDNCFLPDVIVSTTSVGCSDIGSVTVTATAEDMESNFATCTSEVTVEDVQDPFIDCFPEHIASISSAGGTVTVTESDLVEDSGDNCPGETMSTVSEMYDCGDVGTEEDITVTITDDSGNSAMCTSTVVVSDTVAPTAMCVTTPVTVELMASTATLAIADLDDGSTDDCGSISSMTFDNDMTTMEFGCDDITDGTPTMVTMIVIDDSANSASCMAPVEVVDISMPTLNCMDADVEVGMTGTGDLTTATILINDRADDNCANAAQDLPSLAVTAPTTPQLACSDIGSPVLMTVTATDVSGNMNSCSRNVNAIDTTPPVPNCPAQTVSLDATTGMGTLDQSPISATDACTTTTIVPSFPTMDPYSCSDIGTDTVTVTFADAASNESTCDVAVTIDDPTGFCAPSTMPSSAPSESPSSMPSYSPSESPSGAPSESPSSMPSYSPSESPSGAPSYSPSYTPSATPTFNPTSAPTTDVTGFFGGFFAAIRAFIDALVARFLDFGSIFGSSPDDAAGSAPDAPAGSAPDAAGSAPDAPAGSAP